jgi:hypothetical protein
MRGIRRRRKTLAFLVFKFFRVALKFICIGMSLSPQDGEQALPRRRAEARMKPTAT